MSVVPYDRPAPPAVPPIRPWIGLLEYAAELAAMVADTDFVPKALRGNRAAITAAILYGDEVGLGPMQSLSKVRVIDGTPTLAAETQRALILARGHKLWFPELTTTRVKISGQRLGEDEVTTLSWTLDDAKRAGVGGRPAYRTYPRQMLTARASAELARALFADAIGGLRATEEVDEDGAADPAHGEDAPAAERTAAPPTRERRRRRSATLAPVADAPAPDEPAPPPLPGEEDGDAGEPQDQELSTGAQRRKLMALFRERGMTDRAQRLRWASLTLARDVESSSKLTVDEASRLIEILESMAGVTPSSEPARAEAPEPEPSPGPAPAPEPPELPEDRPPLGDVAGPPDPTPPQSGQAGDPQSFIDSLTFSEADPQQTAGAMLTDPQAAALAIALDGIGAPDRNDLLALMQDLGPSGSTGPRYLKTSASDGHAITIGKAAVAIARHWPALEPSPRALVVLRDQLADVQRALDSD